MGQLNQRENLMHLIFRSKPRENAGVKQKFLHPAHPAELIECLPCDRQLGETTLQSFLMCLNHICCSQTLGVSGNSCHHRLPCHTVGIAAVVCLNSSTSKARNRYRRKICTKCKNIGWWDADR